MTDKEGFSPLHLATKNNHTEIVSALINSNKEENKNVFDLVNAVNNDGKTALHLAASNGNPDIFTNLLENEANPNLTDNKGYTALHFAAEKGHIYIAKALLNLHEKNLEPYNSAIDFENNEGDTLHARIAKILLTYKKVKVDGSAEQKISPLSLATQNNNVEFIKLLLDHGADINLVDEKGNTALHIAAKNGKTESFKFLLENGANGNLKNEDGNTARQILENKTTSLSDLGGAYSKKRRVDLNNNGGSPSFFTSPDNGASASSASSTNRESQLSFTSPNNGASALSLSALYNPFPIINTQQALTAPAIPITIVTSPEEEIRATINLFQAIENDDVNEAVRIIEEGKANIEINNHKGNSVLHVAAYYGIKEVVRHPIFSQLNVINRVGEDEKTALHLAAKIGHNEIVEILLQRGANFNAIDKDGCTPLHLAAKDFVDDETYNYTIKSLKKEGQIII